MRKSVTVTIKDGKASWRKEYNGFERSFKEDFPPSCDFETLGFERKTNYKVIYSLDSKGSLIFRDEFHAVCSVPDVRLNPESSNYVDVCFLKGLGWPNGAKVKRTIIYTSP